MTPKITRLNEALLYSLGFDRPTVEALRNMVRVTGGATNSATVPEIGEQADNTEIMMSTLRDHLETVKVIIEALLFVREPVVPDLTGIEAEALAPHVPAAEIIEQVITEVRQIAEQQAVLAGQIQELKQGTTP